MPDFTICTNSACHLANKCYRYLAEPKKFNQSFQKFEPIIGEDCEFFKPIPKSLIDLYEGEEWP